MENDTKRYEPYREGHGWVTESTQDFVRRMHAGPLPNWPDEPLVEWPHRHPDDFDKYAFLGFERFLFKRETWPLDRIPQREAFDRPAMFDSFSLDLTRRAKNPHDWLAVYMFERGTWNTPIILLDNHAGRFRFPNGNPLKSPYHLLEGHRRLAFLGWLRRNEKALPEHEIWLVSLPE